MRGYHDNAAATAKAFPLGLEAGWFDTGALLRGFGLGEDAGMREMLRAGGGD